MADVRILRKKNYIYFQLMMTRFVSLFEFYFWKSPRTEKKTNKKGRCETKVRNVDRKKNLGRLTFTAAEITEQRKNAPQWTKSVQTKGHAKQLSQSVFITRRLDHAFLPFRSEPLDWIFFLLLFFLSSSHLLRIDFYFWKNSFHFWSVNF